MMESDLIARAQQGDKEAYTELIRIHQRTVEKFAFQCGVHRNDLADVSQEVFVKLYRFLHQFKQNRLTTWLYKITLNATRDYYRKEQRQQEKEDKLHAQQQNNYSSAEDNVLLFEEDRLLHSAMQPLDEKYRYATDPSQTTIKVGVKLESMQKIGQHLTFQLSTMSTEKGGERCIITAISE
ncbi:sigma-70 family RNA polymerase sigma factor [Lysinibacillus fusiformis]|uniref:RNA polymerase subunit sigma n=2 Tax=Lysinibacillus TaxID=400634 RepID=A0A2I0V2E1_9BACI|nr:sigma-70 family RNA polymerase sigma factor [Lysinibacillus fusiformis]KUF30160.1 RNA polymerase subunit sigma [Lysinibacillus sp. F5]MEE3809821.1 sigma-70 family RNA polymerase sigma factor [Lysinibacillus fusiformis]PKU52464.1 RNA polymerase subunit sigma [Lysinibacillus fusiformis]